MGISQEEWEKMMDVIDEAYEFLDEAKKNKNQDVDSANLKSIYYFDYEGELEVTFLSGKTYVYYDVPTKVYDTLMDHPGYDSVGKYFYHNLRFGPYKYKITKKGKKRKIKRAVSTAKARIADIFR